MWGGVLLSATTPLKGPATSADSWWGFQHLGCAGLPAEQLLTGWCWGSEASKLCFSSFPCSAFWRVPVPVSLEWWEADHHPATWCRPGLKSLSDKASSMCSPGQLQPCSPRPHSRPFLLPVPWVDSLQRLPALCRKFRSQPLSHRGLVSTLILLGSHLIQPWQE